MLVVVHLLIITVRWRRYIISNFKIWFILGFLAPQGQHITSILVKYDMEERLREKRTLAPISYAKRKYIV